jgi:hypothetical protein
MRPECEEQLLKDVTELKTMVKMHMEQHGEKKSLTPVWVGIAVSSAIGVMGFFGVGKP